MWLAEWCTGLSAVSCQLAPWPVACKQGQSLTKAPQAIIQCISQRCQSQLSDTYRSVTTLSATREEKVLFRRNVTIASMMGTSQWEAKSAQPVCSAPRRSFIATEVHYTELVATWIIIAHSSAWIHWSDTIAYESLGKTGMYKPACQPLCKSIKSAHQRTNIHEGARCGNPTLSSHRYDSPLNTLSFRTEDKHPLSPLLKHKPNLLCIRV